MSKLKVTRASGTGNTFYICEEVSTINPVVEALTVLQRQMVTRDICSKIGLQSTDGFLFLKKKKDCEYQWDFYNSDGSQAEMCGNAARCVAAYIIERLNSQCPIIKLNTSEGFINLFKHEIGIYSVQMPSIKDVKDLTFTLDGKIIEGKFIDSGVPHFVTSAQLSKSQCGYIRSNFSLFPKGTNVTLVTDQSQNELSACSFERGIEDFTPACGTGAVAAAVWHHENYKGSGAIKVKMPGGDLTVDLKTGDNRPVLVGPAELQADLEIDWRP